MKEGGPDKHSQPCQTILKSKAKRKGKLITESKAFFVSSPHQRMHDTFLTISRKSKENLISLRINEDMSLKIVPQTQIRQHKILFL